MIKYLAFILSVFVLETSIADSLVQVVPTDSMAPAIGQGDRIKTSPCQQGCIYSRGDVVAFRYPENKSVTFFKRIVAVPGDTIKIAGERVFLNGEELKRELRGVTYTASGACTEYTEIIYLTRYPICQMDKDISGSADVEVKLDQDSYFLLGDNRQRTRDSRHFGVIKKGDIVGVVTKVSD